ncbi:MAG: hypothetical protein H5T44_04985 [Thermoplasmatales archaeon]|nr:hypothetical protein [Thermoplasmatales archaeon]
MKIVALFVAGLFILSAFVGAKNNKSEKFAGKDDIKTFSWFVSSLPYSVSSVDKENSMRYSFYFITGHYMYEKGFHADGIIFHFPNIYDGKEHWANLTGYAEIKFLDGEYYRNDNYKVVTHWWGSPGFTYYSIKIIFSRKIEFIHLHLDYSEDDRYIRTIDRTFYGRWSDFFMMKMFIYSCL